MVLELRFEPGALAGNAPRHYSTHLPKISRSIAQSGQWHGRDARNSGFRSGGFRRHRRRWLHPSGAIRDPYWSIDTPWFTEVRRGPLRGHATESWAITTKGRGRG